MAFNENQAKEVIGKEHDEYSEFDTKHEGFERTIQYTLPTLSTKKGGQFLIFIFDIKLKEKEEDGQIKQLPIARVMTLIDVPEQGHKKGDVLEMTLGKVLYSELMALPWRGYCFDIIIPKEKKQGQKHEYKVPIIHGLKHPVDLDTYLLKCLPPTSIKMVQNSGKINSDEKTA